jgi:hypothetical protein
MPKIYDQMRNKNIFPSLFKMLLLAILVTKAKAQMPNDAIYMPKKTACVAVMYGSSSWNQYWENTLFRQNLNMGTHTTQNIMGMAAIGVTDKFNVIIGLPYVWTKTSAGNLMGQKGLQDASAWFKYKMIDKAGLSLNAAVGASIPVSNYVPDFLPMSIGLQCKTLAGRLIAQYHHQSGMYLVGHASYTYRSNIKVDRDAYQADGKVYNTNQVRVPNATDASARLGYMKKAIQAEIYIDRFACVGGDNIRRNDMPFPTNNMQATTAGFYGKFQPKKVGFNIRYSQVLSGLNVGKSSSYSAGLLYIIASK